MKFKMEINKMLDAYMPGKIMYEEINNFNVESISKDITYATLHYIHIQEC